MGLLEDKQDSLDVTKQQSVELENQVKQLKTDAMMSRKNLDDLKKRETQLGQDRDAAVFAKACVEQQQSILQQSVQDLDKRLAQEQRKLKKELDSLHRQLEQVSTRNQWMADIMASTVESQVVTRQEWIRQMETQQQEQGKTTRLFVDRIRQELQSLLDEANGRGADQEQNDTLNLDREVKQCQDEVNGLIQRIQSYSMILQ